MRISLQIVFRCILFLGVITWFGCKKTESELQKVDVSTQIENHSLKAGNTQGVIMQAFYWNVPMDGTWWSTIQGKVSSWSSNGITALWMPPSCKCASGAYSCGYDPFDYYDFGDYNQMGTTATRYGTKAALQSCITAAHSSGLKVYADIVMNHRAGGSSQSNPNTGTNTDTNFNPIASGMFLSGYNDFHPSTYETSDAGVFGSYPDLCHANPWVAANLWGNSNSVAKYYKGTMGYDGWRFDWVNGYNPSYVNNFVTAASGFGVTEYWGTVAQIQSCINASGVSSFDMPCMYALQSAFTTNNDLRALRDSNMVCKSNPSKAVTFVSNHDVNYVTTNKLLAYAYILTHEGTPCIFYTDYESELNKTALNTLISINKSLASGTTTVIYASKTEYVAKMSGSPGLIVYINTSGSTATRAVTTNWKNSNIKDFSNNVTSNLTTNSTGDAIITAPANSYTVWSTGGTGGAAPITVTLKMTANTTSGYSLFFTGDQASMTNWGGGLEGSWATGNVWTRTVTVPAGTTSINWKVMKGTSGGTGTTWETGSNHVITSPVNGSTYTATFNGGF